MNKIIFIGAVATLAGCRFSDILKHNLTGFSTRIILCVGTLILIALIIKIISRISGKK